jgi:hypothetical protein
MDGGNLILPDKEIAVEFWPNDPSIEPDPAPDWPKVTPLIERLVKIAAGHGGEFLISGLGEDPETGEKLPPIHLHPANDHTAAANIMQAIETVVATGCGYNCYIGIALMKPGLTQFQKGGESDVVGVLAAVTDWDDKNDPRTRHDRLPFHAQAEIETSPGNFQCWHFFDRPYSVAEAKPVLAALARSSGSDSTHSCDHVFRVPGTLNWPSQKKIEKGRSREPWRARLNIMPEDWDPGLSLHELRETILVKYPDAFDGSAGPIVSDEFDWDKPLKSNYRPLLDHTIYKKLNAEGDRSAISYGVIRQLAACGYTPEQVFDALVRHEDLPAMGHYEEHKSGFEAALRADIIRAFTKPVEPHMQPAPGVFRVGATHGEPLVSKIRPERRQIRIGGNYLPNAVDAAEAALIEQEVDLFQRGDFIVRPGAAPIMIRGGAEIDAERLYEVRPNELREHLTACADFLRYDARSETWKPTNCPEDVARAYLERRGRWGLRYLQSIITAPTLRADGSLLDRPGYDPESSLLFIPAPGAEFPVIPGQPTKAQAVEALGALTELLGTFPFETDADLSVALSAILTAVIRPTLKTAPMHVFCAPRRGSGKGKLADIVAVIATGREASAIVQGRTEEETEKRLGAALLSGDPVILLDNCTLTLEGDFLNAMLTADTVRPRILGKSEAPKLPAKVMMLATGNNLLAKGDMTRRLLRCTIDPKVEYPEQRSFENEPVTDAKRDRLRYLTSALTVLRAYIVAGRPKMSVPLGSFEQWNMIRDALIWLDQADPCDTKEAIEADDPEKDQLASVLQLWHDLIGSDRVSTKELIAHAAAGVGANALHDALRAVAPGSKGDAEISPDRLGKYLSRNVKVVVGNKRLVEDGKHAGGKLWRLELVDARAQVDW